ncbi:MAG: hypothetical protein IR164_05705 [Devosia sp.]|uniref:hypothetical protein n=1 Tax=Devosia sp. TaxID=1871048 RepID=UPI0019F9F1C8|nr:hypothetical protein [Devosia sp.]MBF0678421.1 hypothetical protein [Devosia sp.]
MAKLEPEQVAVALQETGAIIMDTAGRLGVSRTALYKFLERHPELKRLRTEIEDGQIDVAELHIVEAIKAGEMSTIRWYLERKGKARGFSTRQEVT